MVDRGIDVVQRMQGAFDGQFGSLAATSCSARLLLGPRSGAAAWVVDAAARSGSVRTPGRGRARWRAAAPSATASRARLSPCADSEQFACRQIELDRRFGNPRREIVVLGGNGERQVILLGETDSSEHCEKKGKQQAKRGHQWAPTPDERFSIKAGETSPSPHLARQPALGDPPLRGCQPRQAG
jgi:hypothetical protein